MNKRHLARKNNEKKAIKIFEKYGITGLIPV